MKNFKSILIISSIVLLFSSFACNAATQSDDDIDKLLMEVDLIPNHDLSQVELASKAGIDQSDLSKIEKGLANPSIKQITRVLSVLNQRITIESK